MPASSLILALLCGGPSAERGISLNSARSACDHLEGDGVEVMPIYFDLHGTAYKISRGQLYCNTPSDFDFKLKQLSKPMSPSQLSAALRSVDIVLPVIHGAFGEDGGIQSLLEKLKVRFIGSPSQACRRCFDKFSANELIQAEGFYAPQSLLLTPSLNRLAATIKKFLSAHDIKRAIVKPAAGGSSIGVFSVRSVDEAAQRARELFDRGYERVVLEKFCEGTEFTVVILQNRFGQPVSLMPVEIETDYSENQIFDYRKKYLPTRQAGYHCPPRFPDEVVQKIQTQAEQLFSLFGMRDFVRFDGWFLDNGEVQFSDFNPVSGMEQNSFLFLQGARIGLTHRDVLRFILKNACAREGLHVPEPPAKREVLRKRVNVLFGGVTAERQVSVMSGTNIWLKLTRSKTLDPHPYLFDVDGQVWMLPYSMTLNHTVEEMSYVCRSAVHDEARNKVLRSRVIEKLAARPGEISTTDFVPTRMSLMEFVNKSEFVFIALHGGVGEDGKLQTLLDKRGICYNGSDAKASALCMNKYKSSKAIEDLVDQGIFTAPKRVFTWNQLKRAKISAVWSDLCAALPGTSHIVKPVGDGCSAGVARLSSAKDLESYISCLKKQLARIPAGTLDKQSDIIEMPLRIPDALLFEQYIETDRVKVVGDELQWEHRNGWIEITVGVLGKKGKMHAMSPSITVAGGNVLTVEEKFQGGTGVNITPPPKKFVSDAVCASAKRRIEIVANRLGIRGYARIDAFLNISTGELLIIEANSLPGLTPSTVIFHQALEEKPKMYPKEFLEKIVELSGY